MTEYVMILLMAGSMQTLTPDDPKQRLSKEQCEWAKKTTIRLAPPNTRSLDGTPIPAYVLICVEKNKWST